MWPYWEEEQRGPVTPKSLLQHGDLMCRFEDRAGGMHGQAALAQVWFRPLLSQPSGQSWVKSLLGRQVPLAAGASAFPFTQQGVSGWNFSALVHFYPQVSLL